MMPMTPSGTRTRWIRRPLGRVHCAATRADRDRAAPRSPRGPRPWTRRACHRARRRSSSAEPSCRARAPAPGPARWPPGSRRACARMAAAAALNARFLRLAARQGQGHRAAPSAAWPMAAHQRGQVLAARVPPDAGLRPASPLRRITRSSRWIISSRRRDSPAALDLAALRPMMRAASASRIRA